MENFDQAVDCNKFGSSNDDDLRLFESPKTSDLIWQDRLFASNTMIPKSHVLVWELFRI